jgi:CRP-like cAMP-binding protein
MSELVHILTKTLQKFERRNHLDDEDRAAFLRLPIRMRNVEPNQYLVREGDITTDCCLLVDGYAYRQKTTVEGARQILSLHLAGDFIDLEAALLRHADHNIQALTRCDVAMVPCRTSGRSICKTLELRRRCGSTP